MEEYEQVLKGEYFHIFYMSRKEDQKRTEEAVLTAAMGKGLGSNTVRNEE
jgi:hypothetical protein